MPVTVKQNTLNTLLPRPNVALRRALKPRRPHGGSRAAPAGRPQSRLCPPPTKGPPRPSSLPGPSSRQRFCSSRAPALVWGWVFLHTTPPRKLFSLLSRRRAHAVQAALPPGLFPTRSGQRKSTCPERREEGGVADPGLLT